MEKFLGKDPADGSLGWREWQIQAYIVQELRRLGYLVHGDQNGASKTPKGLMEAAAMGACPGWPDLTIALPERIVWVELKIGSGRLSDAQHTLHSRMAALGHWIEVIKATSPADGLAKVLKLITVH